MQNREASATRMEMRKLKTKLKTAEKGFNLLKEKLSKLIHQFFEMVLKTKELRVDVEKKLIYIFQKLDSAQASLKPQEIDMLFSMPNKSFEFEFGQESSMGFVMPQVEVSENTLEANLPFSPLSSNSKLEKAIFDFNELYPKMIELAILEKKVLLVSKEIEKSKRRVSALENILIPNYIEQIKNIETRLSENERENTSRLMKVKKMITKKD